MKERENVEIYKTFDIKPKRQTVVALGLFDGVHRGHQKVISAAVSEGVNTGKIPVVFSFRVDKGIPEGKQGQKLISTDSVKREIYKALGVKMVYLPEFSDIRGYSPDSFFKDILIEKLNAAHIVCGYDFRFGAKAAGDVELLKKYAGEYGCKVTVVPPVAMDGERISSTRIRKLLESGETEKANQLLGYEYSFDFKVKTGRRLGRTLGFPTINQEYPDGFLIPQFGVYASLAQVNGKDFFAVTDVGIKPTVGGVKRPLAETYIMGVSEDLYGRKIKISLVKYLREEKKFSGIDSLKKQIEVDKENAAAFLESYTRIMCG